MCVCVCVGYIFIYIYIYSLSVCVCVCARVCVYVRVCNVCVLEGDTGVNSQTSPVPLPQKLISSRPNPTKKLGENPVTFHSRKNDSHSLPLPCRVFFSLRRNLSVTVKI